jgi:glycosyltransferase 2 family protein
MLEVARETTNGITLPKSVLRWVAVGLVLSSAVVAIITISSGVTLSDIGRLGYLSFVLAAAASLARLPVQDVRFRLIASGLAGDSRPNLSGWALARTASEFVALSTPAMIGGEFVRAAWLSRKGVDGGKALWIGYFEVILDVYVGSALALISAWFALTRGAAVIALTIVLIVFFLVTAYSIFFVIPALRGIPKVPHRLFAFAGIFIGGEAASRLEIAVQKGTETFSLAAAGTLRKDALPLILKAVGLTVIQVLLSGMALWFVLIAAGLKIDPLSATLVAGGTSAIAAIPITIGGSGLTELTMQSYLSSVYGFSSWTAVVIWRIASFQVVLAVTGIAFLLLVRRPAKQTPPKGPLKNPDRPLGKPVPGDSLVADS